MPRPAEAARIVGIYRRHAATWAARRGASLPEKTCLDRFLAVLPKRRSVLDIGCGSGVPIAQYFLCQGCRVIGVDASPEMIEMARRRVPTGTWALCDIRSMDLGATFDGLLAWDSFFHLTPDDQRAMFPVFRRHAAPAAALMFTSGPRFGVAMGEMEGEPLYHASLDPEEYRDLLDRQGFEVVHHVVEDPDCGGHTIWLAQRRDGPSGGQTP